MVENLELSLDPNGEHIKLRWSKDDEPPSKPLRLYIDLLRKRSGKVREALNGLNDYVCTNQALEEEKDPEWGRYAGVIKALRQRGQATQLVAESAVVFCPQRYYETHVYIAQIDAFEKAKEYRRAFIARPSARRQCQHFFCLIQHQDEFAWEIATDFDERFNERFCELLAWTEEGQIELLTDLAANSGIGQDLPVALVSPVGSVDKRIAAIEFAEERAGDLRQGIARASDDAVFAAQEEISPLAPCQMRDQPSAEERRFPGPA